MKHERLLRLLLPPACREHVLGDLRECELSSFDLVLTVLAVIWSQMRRATPARIGLTQTLAAYFGFAMAALATPEDHLDPWIHALLPAAASLILFIFAAYRPAGPEQWRRRAPVAMASTLAGLAAASVMPLRTAAGGAFTAFVLIMATRTFLSMVEPWIAQPAAISMQQVRGCLRLFEEEIRRRNRRGYLATTAVAGVFGAYIYLFPNPVQRLGSLLTVAACIFLSQVIRRKGIAPRPNNASDQACLRFFRTELARQRDFHRGLWGWLGLALLAPGIAFFGAGMRQLHPQTARFVEFENLAMAVMALAAIVLNRKIANKYQRQIDQLATIEEAE